MKKLVGLGLMIIALTFGLAAKCQAQDTGKWAFTTTTDAMTDITSAVLMLASENGPEQSMAIKIEGKKKKLQVFLIWNKFIAPNASNFGSIVTCRFGDGEPKLESTWSINTTKDGTWRRGSQRQTLNFIKKMMKVDRFIAQIKPYRENMLTATYDVTGLAEAFKPLQEMLGSER